MKFENCKTSAKYCNFTQVRKTEDALVEDCLFCHRREVYKLKENGQAVRNEKYMLDHIRDFCQPFGITSEVFVEVYGRAKQREFEKRADEKMGRQGKIDALDREYEAYMKAPEKTIFA
jgi:hypothetical protein